MDQTIPRKPFQKPTALNSTSYWPIPAGFSTNSLPA